MKNITLSMEEDHPWTSLYTLIINDRKGIVKSAEDAYKVIRLFEKKTCTRYSVWKTIRKGFGCTDYKYDAKKCSIKWHENIPYILLNVKKLDCHHGVDRAISTKRKKKSCIEHIKDDGVYHSKTKKFNCPAKIDIQEILLFEDQKISLRAKWRAAKSLKEYWQTFTDFNNYRRFIVTLPQDSHHENHRLGDSKKNIIVTSSAEDHISYTLHTPETKQEIIVSEDMEPPWDEINTLGDEMRDSLNTLRTLSYLVVDPETLRHCNEQLHIANAILREGCTVDQQEFALASPIHQQQLSHIHQHDHDKPLQHLKSHTHHNHQHDQQQQQQLILHQKLHSQHQQSPHSHPQLHNLQDQASVHLLPSQQPFHVHHPEMQHNINHNQQQSQQQDIPHTQSQLTTSYWKRNKIL